MNSRELLSMTTTGGKPAKKSVSKKKPAKRAVGKKKPAKKTKKTSKK